MSINFVSRLYTPGPVEVSHSVRLAASRKTYGSREPEFVKEIVEVREKCIKVANLDPSKYTCILVQGCGTYGVESTIQTIVPKDARMLVISNGSFGERMAKISKLYIDNVKVLQMDYFSPVDTKEIKKVVDEFKPTHVGMIHSETSSGIINDIKTVGKEILDEKTVFIIDSMSSFGGVDFNLEDCCVDFMCSSPNKCLQSIAGVAVIIAKIDRLVSHSRTLSLDITDQYNFFKKYKMFRFTPPMECILALNQSLTELLEEGVINRMERYQSNTEYIRKEMARIGFKPYIKDEYAQHIVSVYDYPESKNFDFLDFYNALFKANCRIYIFPGKRLDRDLIRIGTIGDNNVENMKTLIYEIEKISKEKKYFE